MKSLSHLHFFTRKLLLLTSVLLSIADIASAIVIQCKPNNMLWEPVSRPEQVTVTSWNTPFESIPDPIIPPESESVPTALSLSLPNTSIPVTELPDDYYGWLDFKVEGISPGQTVLVERFQVLDRAPLPDELVLQQSFLVTDGALRPIGDGFNTNRPNDISSAFTSGDPSEQDGEILAQINFFEPSASTIVGDYIYRVSSPPASATTPTPLQYTPLEYPFAIVSADASEPQGLTGRVLSGGVPVPGALVVKVKQLSGYADLLSGTTTDALGNYTLPSEVDEFDFLAMKQGYVGNFGNGMAVDLDEDVFLTHDIELEAGTRTISGSLADGATGQPLPGVEIFLLDASADGEFISQKFSVTWTDEMGNFSASVTPGIWGVIVRAESVYTMGYVTSAERPLAIADVTSVNGAHLEVELVPAISLIYGKLTNEVGEELFGVKIVAINQETGAGVIGVTDGEGNYQLGVTPGKWGVMPFSFSLERLEHSGVAEEIVEITDPRQSIEHHIEARPAMAELFGVAMDGLTGEPIGRLRLIALNRDLDINENVFQYTFETDGGYSMLLPQGDWRIVPEPREAARRTEKLLFLDEIDVKVDPFAPDYTGEIEKDIIAITVSDGDPEIILTLTDSTTSEPIPGAYLKAFGSVAGYVMHSYAETDANGVARIPVDYNGAANWTVQISAVSLQNLGKKEIPEFTVTVDSDVTEISVSTEDFENLPLQGSLAITGSGIEFTSAAETGRVYYIESSSDLQNWRTMGRVRGVDGEIRLFDKTVPELGRRFYRLAPEVTVAPGE